MSVQFRKYYFGFHSHGAKYPPVLNTRTHYTTRRQAFEKKLVLGWDLLSRRELTDAAQHGTQSDPSKKKSVTLEL